MESKVGKRRVLMLPWLAHGHVSPFIALAKKLAERNFHVYLCSTPIVLNSIASKLTNKTYSLSIEFVELHVPALPELPPYYHTTNGLPPRLMTALKNAFDTCGPAFADILGTLSPDLVIYDHNQPWAAAASSSRGIPAVQFLLFGAVTISLFTHVLRNPGQPYPFSEIGFHGFQRVAGRAVPQAPPEEMGKERFRFLESMYQSRKIILIKSFREIEGKYIDYLSTLSDKKYVPLGPLVEKADSREEDAETMNWLEKKEKCSTVLVSFGSECYLAEDEIEELAHGLDQSQVNFIWVFRFPTGERKRAEEVMPEGFLERVRERGLLVEGWAPQTRILGHPSIGGFVSHCGWNSVMESMALGVPIVAMPMHLDQPANANLVGNIGVGVEIKRDENGKHNREEIAKVIKAVVVEKDGDNVRIKARELSETIRRKGNEEIDEAVKELVLLYREWKLQEKQNSDGTQALA